MKLPKLASKKAPWIISQHLEGVQHLNGIGETGETLINKLLKEGTETVAVHQTWKCSANSPSKRNNFVNNFICLSLEKLLTILAQADLTDRQMTLITEGQRTLEIAVHKGRAKGFTARTRRTLARLRSQLFQWGSSSLGFKHARKRPVNSTGNIQKHHHEKQMQ